MKIELIRMMRKSPGEIGHENTQQESLEIAKKMSGAQYMALYSLRYKGQATEAKLGKELNIEPKGMKKVLTELEERNLATVKWENNAWNHFSDRKNVDRVFTLIDTVPELRVRIRAQILTIYARDLNGNAELKLTGAINTIFEKYGLPQLRD